LSVLLGLEHLNVGSYYKVVGFIILALGTLLYNEIVVLPCGGFDQNTKEAIALREGKRAGQ